MKKTMYFVILMAILFAPTVFAQKNKAKKESKEKSEKKTELKPNEWVKINMGGETTITGTTKDPYYGDKDKNKKKSKSDKKSELNEGAVEEVNSRVDQAFQVIESQRLQIRKLENELKSFLTKEEFEALIEKVRINDSIREASEVADAKRDAHVAVFQMYTPGNPVQIMNTSDEQIKEAVRDALRDTVLLAQIVSSLGSTNSWSQGQNNQVAKNTDTEMPKEIKNWLLDTIAKLNKRMDELNSVQVMFPRLVDEKLNVTFMQPLDSILAGLRDSLAQLQGKVSQQSVLLSARGEKGEKGESGEKGDKGEKGERGERGETGPQSSPAKDGQNGRDGCDGQDGVVSKEVLTKAVDEYLDGKKLISAEVLQKELQNFTQNKRDGRDGQNGKNGANGKDGKNYRSTGGRKVIINNYLNGGLVGVVKTH